MYCPPNVTLSEFWVKNGISHCLFDTVTASCYSLFIVFFGLIQWYMYRKYALVTDQYLRPRSWLFRMQIFISVVMVLMDVARFIMQVTLPLPGDQVVYGYMVIYFLCNLVCWPLSVRIVFLERNYLLPTVPTRGHGVILLIFWTLVFITENLAFLNLRQDDWWFDLKTVWDKVEFGLFVTRYIFSCLLFIIGLKAPGISTIRDYVNFGGAIYDPDLNEETNRRNNGGSTWIKVSKKMKTLLPFLWPRKSFLLQLNVLICFVLLIMGRVINVYVPIYYKLIVDSLSGQEPFFCWQYVAIYVVIKFFQGGGTGGTGFLNNARTFLWIYVQQYTSREVQVQLFSHLHNLSLRWHLGRKTGEVLRVMDRGTDSINSLLNYIIFSILPTIVDIIIAVAFFSVMFNYLFGLVVFVTMILYLAATIIVTEWRTKYRRSMNLADNEQRARAVDSLLNFETVKYYGAEDYEVGRYKESILKYQHEEWKSNSSLCLLNFIQNLVICAGLMVGSLLCAWMVATGKGLTVGDYVLFSTYILQLYTPLNWFGTYYRVIQQNFIDMENMFDLMDEKQEVFDVPGAHTLSYPEGRIELKNVSFHYQPEKPILQNVSLVVEPGKTVAIVGPSGVGKSTIMRLLFRFYDVTAGSILVDGINVKEYTQKSLRQAIGVVPQDTVLFNDSILYNIQYGNVSADESDVIEAAKHADIHEKILTFPDNYETKVGERGLKLSGGEKQRVAIARTILKAPAFILLDEATSALDTQTERNIQAALQQVCINRTVLMIAHRLSTVINADTILVLKEGIICERGSHDELISSGGIYSEMWRQQLEANNNSSNGNETVALLSLTT